MPRRRARWAQWKFPLQGAQVAAKFTRMPILEVENLRKTYRSGEGELTVLKEVSFVLNEGDSLAIVGPSGSGKSTIAALIQRFYDPKSGEVLIDGVSMRELSGASLRRCIGTVAQEPHTRCHPTRKKRDVPCPALRPLQPPVVSATCLQRLPGSPGDCGAGGMQWLT